jgi:hypothetical protein
MTVSGLFCALCFSVQPIWGRYFILPYGTIKSWLAVGGPRSAICRSRRNRGSGAVNSQRPCGMWPSSVNGDARCRERKPAADCGCCGLSLWPCRRLAPPCHRPKVAWGRGDYGGDREGIPRRPFGLRRASVKLKRPFGDRPGGPYTATSAVPRSRPSSRWPPASSTAPGSTGGSSAAGTSVCSQARYPHRSESTSSDFTGGRYLLWPQRGGTLRRPPGRGGERPQRRAGPRGYEGGAAAEWPRPGGAGRLLLYRVRMARWDDI